MGDAQRRHTGCGKTEKAPGGGPKSSPCRGAHPDAFLNHFPPEGDWPSFRNKTKALLRTAGVPSTRAAGPGLMSPALPPWLSEPSRITIARDRITVPQHLESGKVISPRHPQIHGDKSLERLWKSLWRSGLSKAPARTCCSASWIGARAIRMGRWGAGASPESGESARPLLTRFGALTF